MQAVSSDSAQAFLRGLFKAAVSAVQAENCLPPHLQTLAPVKGRTLVLGAGKAAAAMAAVVQKELPGPLEGLVVTRYGHGAPAPVPGIEILEAAHPVPDDMSQEAARRMLALARTLGPDDRLVFLASGGASSVLSLPAEGFSFKDKQALMKHLLYSGASIHEINCVRKHVSAIKGGRLALAAGAADVVTFVISDVPGDALSDVGSGPTLADPTSLQDARDIISHCGAPEGSPVLDVLAQAKNETTAVLPPNWRASLVACAADSLSAAEGSARRQGFDVINLGPDLEGDASTLGRAHAAMALDVQKAGKPTLILSGGETTVKVNNPNGCGGRNMEYALGLAIGLEGATDIHALACDTDGIDGSEDAAGVCTDPTALARATAQGLSARALLAENRSYQFFHTLGDLITTGPTLTNVNDFRAIAVFPKGAKA